MRVALLPVRASAAAQALAQGMIHDKPAPPRKPGTSRTVTAVNPTPSADLTFRPLIDRFATTTRKLWLELEWTI